MNANWLHYVVNGKEMKIREPNVAPMENDLKVHDIELLLKAAGQKL